MCRDNLIQSSSLYGLFYYKSLVNCDENLTHRMSRKLILKIVYCVYEIVIITSLVISREAF
jgi:hypothetical protein